MLTETATLTPDALLDSPTLPGGKHYELSDGELIIVGTAGAIHELMKAKALAILIKCYLRTMSGQAFSETMFTLGQSRAENRPAIVPHVRVNARDIERGAVIALPRRALEPTKSFSIIDCP
jgi:hypothetical protein